MKLLWLPFALWGCLVLGRIGEAQLKMDAMTYAVLAKNILREGSWFPLHYTSQAYATFSQHPPLHMWLLAFFFKIVGITTVNARLFAALFSFGTLFLVVMWVRRRSGIWTGVVAGLLLLTSPAYLKFGTDCLLDTSLVFWMLLASILFERGKKWDGVGVGICQAFAFLTKGLASLSLPLSLFAFLFFNRAKTRDFIFSQMVFGVVLGIWIAFAGGDDFLRHYWQESVAHRVFLGDPYARWNLLKYLLTNWPWTLFFLYSLKKQSRELWTLNALFHIGGFFFSGHWFEHYLVPFYPFACMSVAMILAPFLQRWEKKIVVFFSGVAGALLLAICFWPGRLRTERQEPIRRVTKELLKAVRVDSIQRVYFTSRVEEKWMGLAVLAWETPWDPVFVEELPTHFKPNEIGIIPDPPYFVTTTDLL